MKTQKITLVYAGPSNGTHIYIVERTADTTAYHPGQVITKKEVDILCNNARWSVVITRGKELDMI